MAKKPPFQLPHQEDHGWTLNERKTSDAQTAPELDDKPDTIWVRVTDKSIMTRKPSDADEFDVEYRRADTLSGARMGAVVVAARKFLNDANSAWAAGEPLHKVRTMLDAADDLQAALDALQPGEAQGAEPVAWQWRSKLGPSGWKSSSVSNIDPGAMTNQYEKRPLYATPPTAPTDNAALVDRLSDKIEDLISEFGHDPNCALQCISEHLQLRRQADAALRREAPQAVTVADLKRIAADFEKDSNLEHYICCNGRDCGCQGATAGQYAAYQIRLALRAQAGEA